MVYMLKDVTILIPSFNRHRQLKRLLEYYRGLEINIIVGDSTSIPFPNVDGYKNLKYFHYPNYPYAKKLALIYKKIKTSYVLFCADDDFVIPVAIKKCVAFLKKNPDYNSAHGHYVFFEKHKDNISFYPFYLKSINLDINGKTPSERVIQILSNYMQLLYAVTKTSDIKPIFKLLEKNPKIKNDNLVELFQAITLCIKGKSKTLALLYCAREVTPNSARTYTEELDAFFRKPEYFKEYKQWSEIIVNNLARSEKILPAKAKIIVNKGINSYLQNSLIYIPSMKISLLRLQRLVNKYSLGIAYKIYRLIHKEENINAPKHAFLKRESKRELEKIRKYIHKYDILTS